MRKYTIVAGLLLAWGSMLSCKKNKDNAKPQETIVYETDFSNSDGKWPVTPNPDGSAIAYENGYYLLKAGPTKSFTCPLGQDIFSGTTGDVAIETSVKPEYYNDPKGGTGGLVWNLHPVAQGYTSYVFLITYDGYWAIFRSKPDGSNAWDMIVDYTKSNTIKQNQFNKLRLTRITNNWHFYINDKEVYSMPVASGYANLDRVGLVANTYSILRADYFKAIKLP